MLREDGMLFDDGTIARLSPDHFLITATTQKSADVLEHMEWHLQTIWSDLDVTLTNVADHWAQFAVAGPNSRRVLEAVVTGLDLSNKAFPFMALADARIADVPGRVFRISFSGEQAYEVAVPAQYAEHVWTSILAAGKPHGIVPYGLDALNVLRIEKGHVTGGEINGQTTPNDLGLGGMLKKSGDFIGRTLGQRAGLLEEGRLQLVGLAPIDVAHRLRSGAHLVSLGGTRPEPRLRHGHVHGGRRQRLDRSRAARRRPCAPWRTSDRGLARLLRGGRSHRHHAASCRSGERACPHLNRVRRSPALLPRVRMAGRVKRA